VCSFFFKVVEEELETAYDSEEEPRYSEETEVEEMTTLVLNNIPKHYTQEKLVVELSKLSSFCNFVYLPISGKKNTCRNFAFANFATEEDAANMRLVLSSTGLPSMDGSEMKPLRVGYSALQGFEANVAQCVRNKLDFFCDI